MSRISFRTVLFLAIDIGLAACCLLRYPDLQSRPRAPFDAIATPRGIVVREILAPDSCRELAPGDLIATYAGHVPTTPQEIEFINDFSAIGERLAVSFVRGGYVHATVIVLVPYFSARYIVMVTVVGLVCLLVGVFLLVKRPTDRAALTLHAALVSLGVCTMMAWEGFTRASYLGMASSPLFFVTYLGLVSLFLLFTGTFPRQKVASLNLLTAVIMGPAVLFLVPLVAYHTAALSTRSPGDFALYLPWFHRFHAFLVIYVVAGMIMFAHSYLRATTIEERKKLKWMLFGLIFGPLPFIAFTVIPMTFFPQYLVAEEYTLVFLVALPVSFAIAVIRHHVFDIDAVIRRATAYTIALGTALVLYALVVGAAAWIVGQYTTGASLVSAIVVALLFQPARGRVQQFVDRKFFRVRYNYREAERILVEEINHALSPERLAELVVHRCQEVIPAEWSAVVVDHRPGTRGEVLASRGLEIPGRASVRSAIERLQHRGRLPVAYAEAVEPGVRYDEGEQDRLARLGIALVLPILSEDGGILGLFVLGRKKSGLRYSLEDVDLLTSVSLQSGLTIERLQLQTRLLTERAEARRLEELNRAKSDFVDSVSHEFKKPLASIRMFAELLEGKRRSGPKTREYLSIVIGESKRLDRMVTNVLDSAKIDHGTMQYVLVPTDLVHVAEHVLTTMKYELTLNGFAVSFRHPRKPLDIMADADALAQALMNLIGNAVKYSAETKAITLQLKRAGGWAVCSVRDRGVGIAPAVLPLVFDRFYRDPAVRMRFDGVGLGLPLVKHIVESHHGSVEIQSQPGRGTTVTMKFPRCTPQPNPH
jgi:signal transduction histidine kinase